MNRLIYGSLVLCIFICALLLPAGAADDLENKEAELKKVYQELSKERDKLRKTAKEQQAVLSRLYIINKKLQKTERELVQTKHKLFDNEQRLGVLKVTLVQTEKDLQFKGDRLSRRIAEVYKTGGINYIELLFASKTLGDFINRSYYAEKLLNQDVKLINEIKGKYEEVKVKKTALEGTTAEIRELTGIIERNKRVIANQAQEKKEVYQTLSERRKEYEKRVAELEKSSQEMEAMIQNLTRKRAKEGIKAPRGTGSIDWPLHGRITSQFGYRRNPFWGGSSFHTGLDIAAPHGSPIKAADGGEIIFSGWWDGYGKAVIIDHGRSISTVYGHLSRIYVETGQKIAQGQVIGLVGSTGYSTGPHLHFEVRKNGTPTNPLKWLPK